MERLQGNRGNRARSHNKELRWSRSAAVCSQKAIGPRQLTEEETRKTARWAFQNNSSLTSSEIGKAIGRSRQAVDSYIADLRAATRMELDHKIFRMNRLEIPQERIAKRFHVLPWKLI
jgi:hypothetical protein